MPDDVDRLVADWHRERPDLDVSPLEVLSRVTRIARHLDVQRRTAFAEVGLETWEFDVLAALRRAGAGASLSPGQLAAETLVTSGTMTNRIDRLEQRELVRRRRDPHDRRGVRVVLTDAGRTTVDTALEVWVARERAFLGDVPADDREALAQMLRTVALSVAAATAS